MARSSSARHLTVQEAMAHGCHEQSLEHRVNHSIYTEQFNSMVDSGLEEPEEPIYVLIDNELYSRGAYTAATDSWLVCNRVQRLTSLLLLH
jgi:hypothetical protein